MAEMNQEFTIDLREYFWVIWRKKWLIIGIFLISVIGTYLYARSLTPIYRSSSVIMIQQSDGMQGLFSGEMLFGGGRDKISTYSRMLTTRTFLEQVIQQMDLRGETGKPLSANVLRNKISINAIAGTDLLEISVQDPHPERAMEIANRLVAVFDEKNVEINKASLTSARQFIELQRQEVEKKLKSAEEKLLEYKVGNDIILPTEEAKQTLNQLVEVESLKSKAEIELKALDASIRNIKNELALQSEQIISSVVISQNPLIKKYKGQITELEAQLIQNKAIYTEKHPNVVSLQAQIDEFRNHLKKEVEDEISAQTKSTNPLYQSLYENLMNLEAERLASEAKLEGYTKLIVEYENSLKKLPSKELDLLRLERQAKVSGEIYTMLLTRTEEIKISEAMQTSDIYLVDPAFLPTHPIKPNKKMMVIMVGFLAIFIGIAIILAIELMDTTIRSAEEIEKMLGLPVLGSIPDINKLKKYYN